MVSPSHQTWFADADLLTEEMGEKDFEKKYGALEGVEFLKAVYVDAAPLYAKKGLVRQLSVDNEIAVPINAVVHMLVTSADVIHSWTIPSFGSKIQAVPGRITSTWFKGDTGRCLLRSVLGRMRQRSLIDAIAIRVVPKAAFDGWVAAAKGARLEEGENYSP